MEWKNFGFGIEDGVATITFQRPEKLNALTFEIYADLRDLLVELPHHDDVRVLVITGEGRGFCSGGDVHEIIGELQSKDARGLLDFTRMTGQVVQRMRECPLPIVAGVNGVAAGAGSVIALAADFRLLARSASFAFLFTKVGLAGADMGSAYLLPRMVGLSKATELLVLGERLSSGQADALGLAYKVVEDGSLPSEVDELARKLADGPTLAYASTKMLLSRELDMDLAGSVELEAMTQALLMTSADHAEFYKAFTEGRDPQVDRAMTTAHEMLNPPTLPDPIGFTHAVVAAPGRTVYVGGQASLDAVGVVVGDDIVEQFSQAAANVVAALEAAGARPEDLVSMMIYVTDVAAYKARLGDLAVAYREHFGRHYPAVALFEVKGLFDPAAQVELVCIAVVPDGRP